MARNSGKRKRTPATQEQYVDFKEVKPLNYIQETYLEAIKSNDIIFGIGSAGTGKTFVAASYAASQLFHKRINLPILWPLPLIQLSENIQAEICAITVLLFLEHPIIPNLTNQKQRK